MTWDDILKDLKEEYWYKILMNRVDKAYEDDVCFPPKNQLFRALELTDFASLKVVILGQDPYHDVGQANGLAFSVSNGTKTPPSLKNMFKELYDDLGINKMTNELDDWAKQGVLLLNAGLSVKAHAANSHKDFGWHQFTDQIIARISENKTHVVFVLWGSFAQKKEELINSSRHTIIKAAHPSPLSAYRGFFGSRPFTKINEDLEQHGLQSIDWS